MSFDKSGHKADNCPFLKENIIEFGKETLLNEITMTTQPELNITVDSQSFPLLPELSTLLLPQKDINTSEINSHSSTQLEDPLKRPPSSTITNSEHSTTSKPLKKKSKKKKSTLKNYTDIKSPKTSESEKDISTQIKILSRQIPLSHQKLFPVNNP
ncbi:hypothetical protein PGB90_008902 [Kerria lacca]